jgi:hypothetical protein
MVSGGDTSMSQVAVVLSAAACVGVVGTAILAVTMHRMKSSRRYSVVGIDSVD